MKIITDPTIPERYAHALFNVGKRNGNLPELLAEVEALLPMFGGSPKLRRFLEGPQISTEDKSAVLEKVFKAQVSPVVYQLFQMLLQKSRIEYTQPILERFRVMVERDQGIHEAEVATATELAAADKTTLQNALESYTKAKLRISYRVEPRLIGGVRFSYGDTLIDDSVRGKLDRLRQALHAKGR